MKKLKLTSVNIEGWGQKRRRAFGAAGTACANVLRQEETVQQSLGHCIIVLPIRLSRSSRFFPKSEKALLSLWVSKGLALNLSLGFLSYPFSGYNKTIIVLLMVCLSSLMASTMGPRTSLGGPQGSRLLPGHICATGVVLLGSHPSFLFFHASTGLWANVYPWT